MRRNGRGLKVGVITAAKAARCRLHLRPALGIKKN
jgi:hypothetical protein